MVNIYDANNILIRGLMKIGHGHMTLRHMYEKAAIANAGTEFWVWDGADHNSRRQQIYPPYKMNRVPQAHNIFAQITMFKELLTLTPAVSINCNTYEADDVIGTLAYKLADQGSPVTVHTSDMDYAQLEHPNIKLNGVNTKEIAAGLIPLYKCLVGDPSDNIKGIPGFGAKTWDSILSAAPQLAEDFRQGNYAALLDLLLPRRILNWLQEPGHLDEVAAMFAITQFIEVPDEDLALGIIIGRPDPVKAHAILDRYFL